MIAALISLALLGLLVFGLPYALVWLGSRADLEKYRFLGDGRCSPWGGIGPTGRGPAALAKKLRERKGSDRT